MPNRRERLKADPLPIVPTFGAELRKFRKRAQKTMGDVAGLLGCTVPHVSSVELEDKEPFTSNQIDSVCQLFGLNADETSQLKMLSQISSLVDSVNMDEAVRVATFHQERAKTAEARVDVLENAIRKHRDEKGHDRCWIDDANLYAILPEGVPEADLRLPPPEEMLENCQRYIEKRHNPALPFFFPEKSANVEVERLRRALMTCANDPDARPLTLLYGPAEQEPAALELAAWALFEVIAKVRAGGDATRDFVEAAEKVRIAIAK